jgi:DNA-binding response OmpR family regulator
VAELHTIKFLQMSHGVPAVRFGRPVILVADRNPIIRKVVQTMLVRQGFRVLLASTPDGALKVATRFSARLDLVIVDVEMGATTGLGIVNLVARQSPGLPLLVMSSQWQQMDQSSGRAIDCLAKPFTQAVLVGKVRALTARSGVVRAGRYKIVSLGR